ncbi:MAG TPA: aldehyde dehydrogenase family protein [Methylocella sp.]|nr:aldehyde dehydrogenase family protein [Methylocella sp.]
MHECLKFYINGAWIDPIERNQMDVINPANEEPAGRISLGSPADVDLAVAAARAAFPAFSQANRQERVGLLERILAAYEDRASDLVAAVSEEMGAPLALAQKAQVPIGAGHLRVSISALKDYVFEAALNGTVVVKEPIGVCGFITPWNWPLSQILCKVAPALAMGCPVVLKPSELAPFSAVIFAEIMDAAGTPPGVFNLINGEGPVVGAAIAAHKGIDLVSFTGSTPAGIEVARAAAPTVKRVLQELGGKSPNIILDDADLEAAVTAGVALMMRNSGQSCNAPSRMLVPRPLLDDAIKIASNAAQSITVGDPRTNVQVGPVVSLAQWTKIQDLIGKGIAEGATLVAGGLGRPVGLNQGYYVKPTVFAHVSNDMTIARSEIFGPVLSILSYETEEEAIAIGNDTDYGLAAYIQSGNISRARRVAAQLRAGQILINEATLDLNAPFGGYKQSGNGRERGVHAFNDYLELKAIIGFHPAEQRKA